MNKYNDDQGKLFIEKVKDQNNNFMQPKPKICAIGIGGGGGNAINNLIKFILKSEGFEESDSDIDNRNNIGIKFIVANTDSQALGQSLAHVKIQLGAELTKGFGAGGDPAVGRDSADESREEIMNHLKESDLVFITAGMGGGTGTGAGPLIAKYLHEMREEIVKQHGRQHGLSTLIVGVVTTPWAGEGMKRARNAEQGLNEMRQYVDTLIVVPNQNMFRQANEKTTLIEMFAKADDVLCQAIRCIYGMINDKGLINVDFADVRSVLGKRGKAIIGIGHGTGEDRAINAILDAMSNPILDKLSLKKAKAVLVSITGGEDLTLFEVDNVLNKIRDEIYEEAEIILGSVYDPTKTGEIVISIIATGIEDDEIPERKNIIEKRRLGGQIPDQTVQIDKNAKGATLASPEREKIITLDINEKEINLSTDEKLEKLGFYNKLPIASEKQSDKTQKQGMFAKLGFDIPAYLRRKKKTHEDA